MTEAEALALAAKRNAHKGKALWNKAWQPTYSREKAGWAVVLVDSDALRMQQAAAAEDDRQQRLARAVDKRDLGAFLENATVGDLKRLIS